MFPTNEVNGPEEFEPQIYADERRSNLRSSA
jgi:hypothetical protein